MEEGQTDITPNIYRYTYIDTHPYSNNIPTITYNSDLLSERADSSPLAPRASRCHSARAEAAEPPPASPRHTAAPSDPHSEANPSSSVWVTNHALLLPTVTNASLHAAHGYSDSVSSQKQPRYLWARWSLGHLATPAAITVITWPGPEPFEGFVIFLPEYSQSYL